MKIVLAPDSFKECMDAHTVCHHLRAGILNANPLAEVVSVPMADGGEGSARILSEALNLVENTIQVSNPIGRPVAATYGVSSDGHTAVIETAQANGLGLLTRDQRNPMLTSTKGCGELIRHALEAGATTLYLCIGGSSTVDGGKDLEEMFGYRFVDASGTVLAPGGGSLIHLDRIIPPETTCWSDVNFRVVCDVTNPLLGVNGAARVFAPQKGADPEMVDILEAGFSVLARCIKRDLGIDCDDVPGAGAAGGLGAGLMAFLGARLEPGAQVVMEAVKLAETMDAADAVITGEGRSDVQTLQGKVPQAVASLAKSKQIPAYVVSGDIRDRDLLTDFDAFSGLISLRKTDEPLSESIKNAPFRLEDAAERVTLNLLKELS